MENGYHTYDEAGYFRRHDDLMKSFRRQHQEWPEMPLEDADEIDLYAYHPICPVNLERICLN